MPDRNRAAKQWRQNAIGVLGNYLVAEVKAVSLSNADLRSFADHRFTDGWLLPTEVLGEHTVQFQLLIDATFPYSAPRVGVVSGPKALEWPHIEEDDLLCLVPANTVISPNDPVGVARAMIAAARKFIAELDPEDSDKEFRREFQSYWQLALANGAPLVRTLNEPSGPSRKIAACKRGKSFYLADDAATLEGWLTDSGVQGVSRSKFEIGLLIWLPEPLVPSQFPSNGADVLKLAEDAGDEAVDLLKELVDNAGGSLLILFGAKAETGVCFAAVLLSRAQVMRRNRNHSTDGFRPGRFPASLVRKQYLGKGGQATRCLTSRADHEWIHGRDNDPTQASLKKKRILVLGCGSIGGGVARYLAQSGVGSLTLVDGQMLTWPNIGRHTLGASSVYSNKAEALALALRKDFPHLAGIEHRAISFGIGSTSLVAELSSFDLIVAVTGEWSVDALLSDLQASSSDFPPIVFGWVEPHATAGHAVLIDGAENSACLRCGFSSSGRFARPVTKWTDGAVVFQEPECGAVFSPYGPIDQAWSQALISDLAIDALVDRAKSNDYRIWIGGRERLEGMGGAWADHWIASRKDAEHGERVVRSSWERSASCVCTHGTEAA